MYRHLVTVKVSIKRCTNKRMQFNCLTFYQNRLKCLNTESVKCRSTIQHNRMLTDYFLENIPDSKLLSLNHFLCILYIVRCSVCHQFFHHKRFEQLDCHLFWQTTLINFQLRSHYDNRTSGVIHTFTEQVLTKTSLLTFQKIGQRFQCTVARSCYRSSTTAIINQCIDRLLQHTFLVSNDDVRCTQLQ